MSDHYEDIISHLHYQSPEHARMSMENRAAQFSPFAALTGYEEAVEETARLTEEKRDLDETRIEELNGLLQELLRAHKEECTVIITYFVPDDKKVGGRYESVTGNVKKVDTLKSRLSLEDGTKIDLDCIRDIVCVG